MPNISQIKLPNNTTYDLVDAGARQMIPTIPGVVSKTANGLCPKLPNESATTKYLRQDGSWQVPPDHTYSIGNGKLTLNVTNGTATAAYEFTANQSGNTTVNIDIPNDTNNAVTQTNTGNSNNAYRLLYSGTADDSTRTEGARKGRIFWNPNNYTLFLQSTSGAQIRWVENQILYIRSSNEANYGVQVGVRNSAWTFAPIVDNYMNLGSSGYRWRNVFAVNGAINTSDRKEKKDIESLDDKSRDFILKLKPVSYKLIHGESGRTHYGKVAQDVEEVMEELGMTDMDFAGFCKDPVTITHIEGVDGEKVERRETIENEFIYGLRYDEFIAPLIKTVQMQQQEIEELKQEINCLKVMCKLL